MNVSMNRDEQQVSRGHMPSGVSCAVRLKERSACGNLLKTLQAFVDMDQAIGCKNSSLIGSPCRENRATQAGIHAARVKQDGTLDGKEVEPTLTCWGVSASTVRQSVHPVCTGSSQGGLRRIYQMGVMRNALPIAVLVVDGGIPSSEGVG